jgi:GNAT superfamily N-acetyltransferase
VSPSVNDQYGLLTEGFDRSPTILMAYNPEYYRPLIERAGFSSIKELYAYVVSQEKVFTEKLVRMSEVVKQRTGVTFRHLDMKDFAREVETIHELYSRGWEGNWGEVPMTDAEFDALAADLKAVIVPELVLIAEAKGRPIGFSLSLPDINIALKNNRGGHLLPGLWHLMTKKRRFNWARVIVLGVIPEYQRTGAAGVLFYETAVRAKGLGYHYGEASWVLEDNVMMNRGAQMMNGQIIKKHRMYQLSLR